MGQKETKIYFRWRQGSLKKFYLSVPLLINIQSTQNRVVALKDMFIIIMILTFGKRVARWKKWWIYRCEWWRVLKDKSFLVPPDYYGQCTFYLIIPLGW